MSGYTQEEFMNTLKSYGNIKEHQETKETSKPIPMDNEPCSKKRKIDDGQSNFGHVEIKRLEHSTRTLQKNIRIILNDAPDLSEVDGMLNSNELDRNTRLDLENNELVKLSTQLKTQYLNGHLEIFDSILNNNVEIRNEKNNSGILGKNIPATQSKEMLLESTETDSTGEKIPELPVIHDAKLCNRVFVHKSIINNKSYLHKSELMASHNERLEFLGDSVLNNIVTVIIYNKFPEASEGELSKIRSLLVNNVTLAEFSIMYGFEKKLRSNINEEILKDSTQKIYADLFEAYIGALAIEKRFDYSEIQQWLEKLMESKINNYDQQIRKLEEINKDAKSELYSLIGTAAFHPQYTVVRTGDGSTKPFVIQCTMGDDILGEGTAPSNREAGLRAAMEALKNKPLLEKYSQIRLNMDRNQSVISNRAPHHLTSKNSDLESPKPIDKSMFPLVGKPDEDINNNAKNELYSILGRTTGSMPVYETYELPSKQFRADLKVKNILVATATDISKKRASSRAAMTVLNDQKAIDALCTL